nr:hypothetical protein CFP56_01413 [Quercus suber]
MRPTWRLNGIDRRHDCDQLDPATCVVGRVLQKSAKPPDRFKISVCSYSTFTYLCPLPEKTSFLALVTMYMVMSRRSHQGHLIRSFVRS